MKITNFIRKHSPELVDKFIEKIESSEIVSRLVSGVFWSMLGAISSRGLLLIASVLVARALGKNAFGELAIIQSTVGMFGVFAGFGLGLTATKYVAEFRSSAPDRAGNIIALSGIVASVTGALLGFGLYFYAPWLATHTINASYLVGDLRISSIMLFVSAINGAQIGSLSGFEAFKSIARINLLVGLISFPTLLFGAYYGGRTGVIWAMTLNLGVNYFFNHYLLKKEIKKHNIPLNYANCASEFSILWKFSVPALLGGALVGPITWATNAMLVNQPDGFGELGIYNAANQWQMTILFIPGMLGQVVLPILSNLNGVALEDKYLKVLKLNIFLNISIATFVVLPIIIGAPQIMKTYGPSFGSGSTVLRILAFTAILIATNNVIGQAIISKSKMWMGFMFNGLWAITMLITTYIFLNRQFGAAGLAMASMVAYVFHSGWQSLYLVKILNSHKIVN